MSLEQLEILQKAQKENNREILDGYNNEIEEMIEKIETILNTKPTYIGQVAIFAILVQAYHNNGYQKKDLHLEIDHCWDFYYDENLR